MPGVVTQSSVDMCSIVQVVGVLLNYSRDLVGLEKGSPLGRPGPKSTVEGAFFFGTSSLMTTMDCISDPLNPSPRHHCPICGSPAK